MKIDKKSPPRKYTCGLNNQITISDCGFAHLDSDEQLTFLTKDGKEYDLCRKEWGYYATPSVNGRLKNFGFKTALVKNSKGLLYVILVEKDKINYFQDYLQEENQSLVEWLDERPVID